MLYDQQANFHNLDASSAENTERNDKKTQTKSTHRHLPLLSDNENAIFILEIIGAGVVKNKHNKVSFLENQYKS